MKKCRDCGKIKPIVEFYKRRNSTLSYCKACYLAEQRTVMGRKYKEDADFRKKSSDYKKKHYKLHKKKILATHKKRREAEPERIREDNRRSCKKYRLNRRKDAVKYAEYLTQQRDYAKDRYSRKKVHAKIFDSVFLAKQAIDTATGLSSSLVYRCLTLCAHNQTGEFLAYVWVEPGPRHKLCPCCFEKMSIASPRTWEHPVKVIAL